MRLAVLGDDGLGLLVGEVLDALQGAQVELHPGALVVLIIEAVGVTAEAVHVAERQGYAARTHRDGDLVQCLGKEGPEVPVVRCAAHARAWVALDGVVEVGELQRVAQEEYGGVVAHEVPVALFGVELHGKATDVAFGIGSTTLASHGGEAHEALGLLAHLAEDGGTGILRDVVRHGKGSVGSRSLGVHAAFGDDLAVEVGEFLYQPRVLQEDGATLSGSLRVLVVGHRTSVGRGQSILFHC